MPPVLQNLNLIATIAIITKPYFQGNLQMDGVFYMKWVKFPRLIAAYDAFRALCSNISRLDMSISFVGCIIEHYPLVAVKRSFVIY